MAYYRVSDTGKRIIFWQMPWRIRAKTAQAPLLAQIPLDPSVADYVILEKLKMLFLMRASL